MGTIDCYVLGTCEPVMTHNHYHMPCDLRLIAPTVFTHIYSVLIRSLLVSHISVDPLLFMAIICSICLRSFLSEDHHKRDGLTLFFEHHSCHTVSLGLLQSS
jgi:hypothetical protein